MTDKPLVSICILTYNAEEYLERNLEIIFLQNTKFKYEINIVDSGSTDSTLAIAKQFKVNLFRVENRYFNHGETRNRAAALSKGKYIVFLVQDATPASPYWLQRLIEPFITYPAVVAVFGRHLPRRNAIPPIKKDIDQVFYNLSPHNILIKQKLEPKRKYGSTEWQQLIYFSDVNCAIKKSFLKKHPYKKIDYAEDRLMDEQIIKKKFLKIYQPEAAVYHSHTYPLLQYFFRYFDEYNGLKKSLGYKDNINLFNYAFSAGRDWLLDVKYIVAQKYRFSSKVRFIFLSLGYEYLRKLSILLVNCDRYLPPFISSSMSLEQRNKKLPLYKRKFFSHLAKIYNIIKQGDIGSVWRLGTSYVRKLIGLSARSMNIDDDRAYMSRYIHAAKVLSGPQLHSVRLKKVKAVNWLLPDFGVSSGGHMTVFRVIRKLESSGIKNNIYMLGPLHHTNKENIVDLIKTHYLPIKASVNIGIDKVVPSDLSIATSWHTAYIMSSIKNAGRKVYLVQDFEPYFYPVASSLSIYAESSYRLGHIHLCASKWTATKLKSDFSAQTHYFQLGFDDRYYYSTIQAPQRDKKTILFYARPSTPRRAFELGIEALALCFQKNPAIHIKLFGYDQEMKNIPFPYENLGVLDQESLGNLYRQATVGLSLSLTNISLIPIEMSACSLPVVEINTPAVAEYYQTKKDILLSDRTALSIAKNLLTVINNQDYSRSLARNAYERTVKQYNWDSQLEKINTFLLNK